MKILLAGIFHETNTFSPIPCSGADFTLGFTLDGSGSVEHQHGQRVIDAMRGTKTAQAAFIDACEGAGAEIILPFLRHRHSVRALRCGLVSGDV
ncbi:MAG: M81 family metallopeptidase [Pararhodobacter sp.]|nr:M81 family metallopeptidase [Pararhodobacter sp.]